MHDLGDTAAMAADSLNRHAAGEADADDDDVEGSSPKSPNPKSPVKKLKSSALPSHLECTDLVTKILGACLQEPEDVWDEVYCMLMKQTTANPMREGRRRGWHLFAMLSTTLPPSPALMPCVEDHLRINIEDQSDPVVAKYATRTM